MVRPLAYRTLPLLSSHCTRTFITGYPRIPQKFEQYPNFDDATDPGMVSNPSSLKAISLDRVNVYENRMADT